MPTVHRKGSWAIIVRGREHGEPHFHLNGTNWRCVVSIDSLAVLAGEAPSRELRDARDWAGEHRELLMETWRRMNQ